MAEDLYFQQALRGCWLCSSTLNNNASLHVLRARPDFIGQNLHVNKYPRWFTYSGLKSSVLVHIWSLGVNLHLCIFFVVSVSLSVWGERDNHSTTVTGLSEPFWILANHVTAFNSLPLSPFWESRHLFLAHLPIGSFLFFPNTLWLSWTQLFKVSVGGLFLWLLFYERKLLYLKKSDGQQ